VLAVVWWSAAGNEFDLKLAAESGWDGRQQTWGGNNWDEVSGSTGRKRWRKWGSDEFYSTAGVAEQAVSGGTGWDGAQAGGRCSVRLGNGSADKHSNAETGQPRAVAQKEGQPQNGGRREVGDGRRASLQYRQ
jgi:hypothetical protein